MSLASIARWLGNGLYKTAFPIYRPLYSAFKGYADRCERDLLRQLISPGTVAVDAGANIGIYTQFLARCVGPSGKVHGFEPDPGNFTRLRAAVSSLPNVNANQLAVSDKTGDAILHVSDNLNVDHRAYPSDGEIRRTVAIQAIRLDDYFRAGDRVDVIKIDIQGFELHALRGASRILVENRDIKLLLELWPYGLLQAGVSADQLLDFLRQHDFAVFQIEKAGLVPGPPASYGSANRDAYWNLFAARTSGPQPKSKSSPR